MITSRATQTDAESSCFALNRKWIFPAVELFADQSDTIKKRILVSENFNITINIQLVLSCSSSQARERKKCLETIGIKRNIGILSCKRTSSCIDQLLSFSLSHTHFYLFEERISFSHLTFFFFSQTKNSLLCFLSPFMLPNLLLG